MILDRRLVTPQQKAMVNNESEVLPSPVPGDEEGTTYDATTLIDDPGSLIHRARSSRPTSFYKDGGWRDGDHYFDDRPSDDYQPGWKEAYTRMDDIQVNGALRRQWIIAQAEIEQITDRC